MTAQICVPVEDDGVGSELMRVRKLVFPWTCTEAGVVTVSSARKYSGAVVRVVTVPGAAGDAPTEGYAMTLKNDDGIDLFSGLGASNSATLTAYKNLGDGLGYLADSKINLGITGAGNAKKGSVWVYVN